MASTNTIDFQLTQARALLSEFDNRLRAIDSKWETRVGVLEAQVADSARNLETIFKEIHDGVVAQLAVADAAVDHRIRLLEAGTIPRLAALESTAHAFELWRPHIESSIIGLCSSIDAVGTEVAKLGINGFPGARPSDGAAAPRTATQPEPSSPRPRSPPPPEDNDGDDDDEDYEGFKDEELDKLERIFGWGSLFMSRPEVLCMDSGDPQNPPRYIGRQNCEPLTTQEFFSMRHNWQQLLDGKKTYLRPPKNNRVAKHSYANCTFVTPEPLEKALQCQEPLSDFVHNDAENSTVQQKIKILSEHYAHVRRMRTDGSSFYRAFLFSYLENLGKMQASHAEVTRLMECVARSKENFCRLHWNSAYFSSPEAFFSSVVSEFEHLVNSVANGLNADELYKRSLQEITSSRILCLLRLLTEVHIRTHHANFEPEFRQQTEALLFCIASVRPLDAKAGTIQISALSNALGIPLHLALLDETMNNDGIAKVKCLDFFPQSESRASTTSGPLSSIRSYYLSSATDKHLEQGRDDSNSTMPAGNLFSSDHMPLVALLNRVGHFDILYRK